MPRLLPPLLYAGAIVWINAYVVRHAFSIGFTGQMHSMHGFWLGLARMAEWRIWETGWWPYTMGGQPLEMAYAPLVPWLAKHFQLPAIFAAIYCIVPLALFLATWAYSNRPGWSFAAALVYSLSAPSELLLPDSGFAWSQVREARRLYLVFSWDEAPHYLALAFVCLSAACWQRRWRVAAAILLALAALANPFGITSAALFAAAAMTGTRLPWKTVAVTGLAAYVLVYRFYPLEMLRILRVNAAMAPETAWTAQSWLGALLLAAGFGLIWVSTRRGVEAHLRFFLLLAWLTTAVPALFIRWGIVTLQQPARYKVEMEMAIAVAAVFCLERIARHWHGLLKIALGLSLFVAAEQQLVFHRRFSKNLVRPVDPASTLEYRFARWADENLAGQVVFLPGSMAQWLPAFSAVHQYGGGSYPTAINAVQQKLVLDLVAQQDASRAIQWMQAVGIDAVAVAGPGSGEFWKPYARDIYAGKLPVLWSEQNTPIYRVPRRSRSQAQAVPVSTLVREGKISNYVEALEDPSAPPVQMRWKTSRSADIEADLPRGYAITVHMNWHDGWHAVCGGRETRVELDGLGQLALRTDLLPPLGKTGCELKYGR